MKEKEIPITNRIFRILASSDDGFYDLSAKAKKGVISVFYEKDNRVERFFELDLAKKVIDFHQYPKCYSTEQECVGFISDLKNKEYRIKGITNFVESPQYEKDEISLY